MSINYSIEKWIGLIEEETFQTKLLNLSIKECELLLELSNRKKNLDDKEKLVEKELMLKIKKMLNSFNTKKIFIRLNSTSPKDVFDLLERNKNIQRDSIKKLAKKKKFKNLFDFKNEKERFEEQNEVIIELRKSISKCSYIINPTEVLILLKKSNRINRELKLSLKYQKIWNCKLIFREYNDKVLLTNEFRGFVNENKLNAICQYDKKTYFKELQDNKDEISTKLVNYWNLKVKDKLLNYKSYIIDFVILTNSQVKIIELNPFDVHTGPILFNWSTDKEVLNNGPFEFRINKESPKLNLKWMYDSYF